MPSFFHPANFAKFAESKSKSESEDAVSWGTSSEKFLEKSNQPEMWFNVMIYCPGLQPLDVDMLWAIEKNSRREAWIVENKAVPPVTKEDYFEKKMDRINAVLNFIKNNPKQVGFHILGSENPNNTKEIFRRVAKANNEESKLHQEMLDIFSGDVSVTFRIALDCTQQQNLQLCQKIEDAQSRVPPKERAFSKVRLHAARGPSAIEGNQHQLSDSDQPAENVSQTQKALRDQFEKIRFSGSEESFAAFSANNICEIPSVSVMSILPTHQQALFSKVVVQGKGAIIKFIESGRITLPNGWKFLKISKKGNNKSQAALVVKVEQGCPLESFDEISRFWDYTPLVKRNLIEIQVENSGYLELFDESSRFWSFCSVEKRLNNIDRLWRYASLREEQVENRGPFEHEQEISRFWDFWPDKMTPPSKLREMQVENSSPLEWFEESSPFCDYCQIPTQLP